VFAALGACSKDTPSLENPSDAAQSGELTFTAEQIRALGIATTPARATDYQSHIDGFGMVISLETFAQIYTDIETASAAAAQSAAALGRARKLASGEEAAISREALESAASKAAADQAALALAKRKSDAIFGLQAPWNSARDRGKIMEQLSRGRVVLVHVTFPLGSLNGARPHDIDISRIGPNAHGWHTKSIWSAPADPTVPGSGFFAMLEGADLAQGEHVAAATGTGEHLDGVWIPQSALLLSEGDTWAYVETGSGHFARVRIDISRPDNAGYVLKSDAGIASGQNVVVAGAALLLSRELNPSGAA